MRPFVAGVTSAGPFGYAGCVVENPLSATMNVSTDVGREHSWNCGHQGSKVAGGVRGTYARGQIGWIGGRAAGSTDEQASRANTTRTGIPALTFKGGQASGADNTSFTTWDTYI